MIDSGLNTRCGPICRNVTDAAKVLSVLAGYDPADELTALQIGRTPDQPYETFCEMASPLAVVASKPLEGMRIGVMREYMDKRKFDVIDHENIDIVDQAILKLAELGATIIEPGPTDNGLMTPSLRKYYPAMMNAAYASNEGRELFPEGMSMIHKLLALAENPSMAAGVRLQSEHSPTPLRSFSFSPSTCPSRYLVAQEYGHS
jgi:amidase